MCVGRSLSLNRVQSNVEHMYIWILRHCFQCFVILGVLGQEDVHSELWVEGFLEQVPGLGMCVAYLVLFFQMITHKKRNNADNFSLVLLFMKTLENVCAQSNILFFGQWRLIHTLICSRSCERKETLNSRCVYFCTMLSWSWPFSACAAGSWMVLNSCYHKIISFVWRDYG